MDLPLSGLPLRDPVSALTHLAACAFALYATALLRRLTRGDRTKRLCLTCFGATAVVLYAASTLYHAVPLALDSPAVRVFRQLDHSAIYLLIAGTYTPVLAVLLRGRQRPALLAVIWLLAGAGVAAKWLLADPPEWLEISLYVGLGWLAVVPAAALARAVGVRGLSWIVAGGLSYTIGAAFELARWPVLLPGVVGWHEVFHLCVMAGTALHVVFMVRCVVPFHGAPANSVGDRIAVESDAR
jgi:hemolysin III